MPESRPLPPPPCYWRATSADECAMFRERQVAGTPQPIPTCMTHGPHPDTVAAMAGDERDLPAELDPDTGLEVDLRGDRAPLAPADSYAGRYAAALRAIEAADRNLAPVRFASGDTWIPFATDEATPPVVSAPDALARSIGARR